MNVSIAKKPVLRKKIKRMQVPENDIRESSMLDHIEKVYRKTRDFCGKVNWSYLVYYKGVFF